ncbi:MoxR family ATPase [bacterium]|nr:MoxR family ATPase [bacterium]
MSIEKFDASQLKSNSKRKIVYRTASLKDSDIKKWSNHLIRLKKQMQRVIIGQSDFIENLLITLIANGHLLIVGDPGMGKSRVISALVESVLLNSHSVHQSSNFIGYNLVTIDELDHLHEDFRRDLLTAMQERLSIVDDQVVYLDRPFLIFSTINPQHDHINLSNAEIDRFMFSFFPQYPSIEEEVEIMSLTNHDEPPHLEKQFLTADELLNIQRLCTFIQVDQDLKEIIARIIAHTRDHNNDLLPLSPRISIYLFQAIKARAFLKNRKHGNLEDLQAVFHNVVQHRLSKINLSDGRNKSKQLFDLFLR